MSGQNLPFPPPPPIPGLGGGIGSLLLNRGPAQFQMKKVEKVEFSKQDIPNNFVGKSATIVMRNLDGYRTYTPLDGEKEQYNLPDERLIFSNAQHVMYICGGFAGKRFSSGDMIFITTITKRLNSSYDTLDAHFRAMPNSSKKVAIPPEASTATPAASVCEEDWAAVLRFNELAMLHLVDVKDFHAFVCAKQEEFRKFREETGEEKIIISKDPDGLSGSSKPRWLELLLQCYKQHVVATCSTPEKPPPLTVGKFCRYLSKVVVMDITRAVPIQGESRKPHATTSTSPSSSSNSRSRSGSGGNSERSSGSSSPTPSVGQGEGSSTSRCSSPGVDMLLWGDEERQAMMELIAASNDHTSLFGVTATATAPLPGGDNGTAASERAEDADAAAYGGPGHHKAAAPHGSGLLTCQKIASGSFDDSDGENAADRSQSPLSPRPPAQVQVNVHAPSVTAAAAVATADQGGATHSPSHSSVTSRPYSSPPSTAAARRQSPSSSTHGHGSQFFGQGHHHHGSSALHSQHYYAKRFYDFVSKLSEMKSIPKDEKNLFS